MGQEEVPGHVEAGGDGRAEGKAEGQKGTGPRTAKSFCEIISAVPLFLRLTPLSVSQESHLTLTHNKIVYQKGWETPQP